MTKFVKISLAAAVAVAGMSSVASAKPLEEAIKGVDATGYVTYQYNDRKNQLAGGVSEQDNIYKAGIALTIPATDDVKVKVTGTVRGKTGDNTTTKKADFAGDASPATTLEHANFVYTGVENLSVIAGKQALNTPWTQGSSNIDLTQNGTGILAMYNAGFATFAGAHFINNNINRAKSEARVDIDSSDITVLAAIVPIADLANAQLWYANVAKTTNSTHLQDGAKALNFSLDTKIADMVKLGFTHSELKSKTAGAKKNKLTKVEASGKIDVVGLKAAYAKTGKDGGLVAFDSDGSAGFKGFNADLNGAQNAKAWLLSASVKPMSDVTLALTHIDGEIKGAPLALKQEFTETYGQVTYAFAKNLSAYVRYGVYDVNRAGTKITDRTRGRLQIAYKF